MDSGSCYHTAVLEGTHALRCLLLDDIHDIHNSHLIGLVSVGRHSGFHIIPEPNTVIINTTSQ